MGRIISGANATPNIAVPFPEVIRGLKCNRISSVALILPHPANDGSTISFNGPSIEIYSAANVLLYRISATAINADATNIIAIWLDTADGVLWAIAMSATPGKGYVAKVNYATGIVTPVGPGFTGAVKVLPAGPYLMERAAMGAGDLTLWTAAYGFAAWRVSVSTVTGLVTTAEAQLMQNGIAPDIGKYHTADQALFATVSAVDVNDATSNYSYAPSLTILKLQRGGMQMTCGFDSSAVGVIGASGLSEIMPWGQDAVYIGSFGSDIRMYGTRSFKRSAFDAWLHRIADSLGMPQ